MTNIVEIIKSDYFMEPYVRSFREAYRWNLVMCSTGPAVFTGSAREVFFQDPDVKIKVTATDFKDYGGRFKAVSTRPSEVKGHYMNMHHAKDDGKTGLLKEYKEEERWMRSNSRSWRKRPYKVTMASRFTSWRMAKNEVFHRGTPS